MSDQKITIVSADREAVAGIAGRSCNAQQVYRPPTIKKDRPQPVFRK